MSFPRKISKGDYMPGYGPDKNRKSKGPRTLGQKNAPDPVESLSSRERRVETSLKSFGRSLPDSKMIPAGLGIDASIPYTYYQNDPVVLVKSNFQSDLMIEYAMRLGYSKTQTLELLSKSMAPRAFHPMDVSRSVITGEHAGHTDRSGAVVPNQDPHYASRLQEHFDASGNPTGKKFLPQPDLANHKDMYSNIEGPYTHNRLQQTVRTLVKNGTLQPVKAKQGTFSTPTGAQDYTDSYFGGATDSTGKPYDASTHAWGLQTRDGNPLVKIKQEDGTHMLWVHKKDRGWLPTIGLNDEGYADINEHHFNDPTFGGNTYLQHQSEMLGEALPGEFLRQNHGVLYGPGSWKREGTLEDVHDNTGHHEGDPSKGAMTSEKAVQMAGHPDAENHVRDHWNERTKGLASTLANVGGNNFSGTHDVAQHSSPSFTS